MDYQLKDKKVFISGSTKGIGLATAKTLAKERAEVIINGRSKESINQAISSITTEINNAKISGIACDFSKKRSSR